MQLHSFEISGLFGKFHHKIRFPFPTTHITGPSLVILHGPNGIGKTTILRMLDGLLRLDFNPFRIMPFTACVLRFSNRKEIRVTPIRKKTLLSLDVEFDDRRVQLHPRKAGALDEERIPDVEDFRREFFASTEAIRYELIDTARRHELYTGEPVSQEHRQAVRRYRDEVFIVQSGVPRTKARERPRPESLALRVARFIRDAQVNYRTFFTSTEPDVFPRIIERLTTTGKKKYNLPDLRKRLQSIRQQDRSTGRLGLEADRWDYDQLIELTHTLSRRRGLARQQALAVLDSYVEVLESRAAERELIAKRLMTFERLISRFLVDKKVTVSPREGINITTNLGVELQEHQLSSGEFNFLFLMVAALVAQRRGTVIAIDEPEMSMHIAWQRLLVSALLECASGAEPLFILATHSPDLGASYPDQLVSLRGNSI